MSKKRISGPMREDYFGELLPEQGKTNANKFSHLWDVLYNLQMHNKVKPNESNNTLK